MTYINDNDFVHSVFYTIEKRVYDQKIRNKLHEYFTRNVHHMNYDLFLIFSRAIGELRKIYTQTNIKFSNSFILVLLTYLQESSDTLPKDADVIRIFIDKFMKRTESERVLITIDHDQGFECLRYLASKLNIYIGTSSNEEDRVVRNRTNDYYNFRRDQRDQRPVEEQTSGRRQRSRSNESRRNNIPPRFNNPNTVYASHVTQEQRMEIERNRAIPPPPSTPSTVSVSTPLPLTALLPPTPPQQQPVLQQNADHMIARLVQDNHSLYNAISQRDTVIAQLQNELTQLRNELGQLRYRY